MKRQSLDVFREPRGKSLKVILSGAGQRLPTSRNLYLIDSYARTHICTDAGGKGTCARTYPHMCKILGPTSSGHMNKHAAYVHPDDSQISRATHPTIIKTEAHSCHEGLALRIPSLHVCMSAYMSAYMLPKTHFPIKSSSVTAYPRVAAQDLHIKGSYLPAEHSDTRTHSTG